MQREFYHLFISDEEIESKIEEWRNKYLSHEALARIKLLNQAKSAINEKKNVFIDLPDGQRRKMLPGESSILTKFVIEEFADKFLNNPVVVFVSESGNKVIYREDQLARSIGLNIPVDKSLPDLIIADLNDNNTIIYFIEIVATDGPINTKRKNDLMKIVDEDSFKHENIQFLTVFKDRNCTPFKKNISSIASNTFIWFASEPDHVLIWNTLGAKKISNLLSIL